MTQSGAWGLGGRARGELDVVAQGLELAGEVVGLGPGAARFSEGDRVMAIVGGGGQGELAVVHERGVMPVPEALDWRRAGGASEVFVTAHDASVASFGLFCRSLMGSGSV